MQHVPHQQEVQPGWTLGPHDYNYNYVKEPHNDVSRLFQEEEYRRASTSNAKGRPKPNYRPVSLRWWYISLLAFICLGLAGVVLWADRELRGTDNTAVIERRSLTHDEAWALFQERMDELLPRQESPAGATDQPAPEAPTPAQPEQSPDGAPRETDPAGETNDNNGGTDEPSESDAADAARGRLTTALVEVPFTTIMTKPGPKITVTTFTTTTVSSDVVSTLTSVIPGTTIFPSGPTEGPGEETITITYMTTEENTLTITDANSSVQTVTSTNVYETERTTVQEGPLPSGGGGGGGPIVQPPVTKEIVTTFKKDTVQTVPVTLTKDGPPITYASTGKTTLFSTFTVGANGKQIQGPVTEVMTSEVGGTLRTYVETPSPTTYVTWGPDGLPTTVTETPAPITRVTSEPPTRVVITSVSTPTDGEFLIVEATTYTLTSAGYYIGKFLPPLLAVLLALAVRAVDQTAKLYQPFAALSHPKGALGRDSLTLHFEGWKGFWRPFEMLGQGHPVPFLSTMALWISSVLPPIASEAIGLKVHGRCSFNAIEGCALNLGVSRVEAYVLVGLLITIAILLIAILFVVTSRWKTGVFADPWCVAGAAALARNPDVRGIGAPDFRAVKAAVAEKQFTLGWFRNWEGREEYGLVLCDESGRSLRGARREEEGAAMLRDTSYAEAMGYRPQGPVPTQRKPPATFAFLTFWWRISFLLYLIVLLGLVLFYHLGKKTVPNQVKHFMEGQNFGARFVSSALGVIVFICWECVFCSIVIIAPYLRMAKGPQSANRSILSGRPTYSVTGIFAGIGNRDWLLFATSLMAVLSDFLPMLFANVPYNLTQMEIVHTVCARLSAGLLAVMIAVLFATMFVRWPELPVDPRSVAGEMWYVAEARWVENLEGVAALNDRERKKRMREMGGKWYYGMVSTRLGDRMAVELHDIYGATDYGQFR